MATNALILKFFEGLSHIHALEQPFLSEPLTLGESGGKDTLTLEQLSQMDTFMLEEKNQWDQNHASIAQPTPVSIILSGNQPITTSRIIPTAHETFMDRFIPPQSGKFNDYLQIQDHYIFSFQKMQEYVGKNAHLPHLRNGLHAEYDMQLIVPHENTLFEVALSLGSDRSSNILRMHFEELGKKNFSPEEIKSIVLDNILGNEILSLRFSTYKAFERSDIPSVSLSDLEQYTPIAEVQQYDPGIPVTPLNGMIVRELLFTDSQLFFEHLHECAYSLQEDLNEEVPHHETKPYALPLLVQNEYVHGKPKDAPLQSIHYGVLIPQKN